MTACIFCQIVAGKSPAKQMGSWISTVIIEPLNPVTPGHLLVIPRTHVTDATEDAGITATTMHDAAQCVNMIRQVRPEYESVNFITSVGVPATQSVFHLHIHIVPRREGDGLQLPWTGQER
ncbi:histidine triad nucleotide binding protein [Microbacterium phage Phabia]|nr:histidine triad nucleotide binding protein [Microbacterium phage Phabia]